MKILTTDVYGRIIRHEVIEKTRVVEVVNPDGKVAMTMKFPAEKSLLDILAATASMKTTLDPIASRKEQAREAVNVIRDRKITEPVKFDGALYDCDLDTKLKISGVIALASAGIELPKDFIWRDFDNVDRPMTAAGMIALGATIMEYQYAVFKRSWALKAEIDKSDKPETINLEEGWPG